MKYWIRHFKVAAEVVAAETYAEAMEMDSSDACDTVEVEEVTEIDVVNFIARSHPSWRDYIPTGEPEYRTLAEIAALPDSGS